MAINLSHQRLHNSEIAIEFLDIQIYQDIKTERHDFTPHTDWSKAWFFCASLFDIHGRASPADAHFSIRAGPHSLYINCIPHAQMWYRAWLHPELPITCLSPHWNHAPHPFQMRFYFAAGDFEKKVMVKRPKLSPVLFLSPRRRKMKQPSLKALTQSPTAARQMHHSKTKPLRSFAWVDDTLASYISLHARKRCFSQHLFGLMRLAWAFVIAELYGLMIILYIDYIYEYEYFHFCW